MIRRARGWTGLTRRGWSVVALVVIVAIAWWFIRLRELLLLTVLLATLLCVCTVVAVLVALVARPRASVSSPPSAPSVGESFQIRASVQTRLPFASFVRISWKTIEGKEPPHSCTSSTLSSSSQGEQTRTSTEDKSRCSPWKQGVSRRHFLTDHHLRPRHGTVTLPVKAYGRGRIDVTLYRVAWTDPLGLVRVSRTVRARDEILVLPRHTDLGGVDTRAGAVEGMPVGKDEGEACGLIREYRNGDALRRVHWKQSARVGRLLVNVPEQPEQSWRAVTLDTRACVWDNEKEFEQAVAVVRSFVEDWLNLGEQISVAFGNERVTSVPDGGHHTSESFGDAVGIEGITRRLALICPTDEDDTLLDCTDDASSPLIVTGRVDHSIETIMHRTPAGVLIICSDCLPARERIPNTWTLVHLPARLAQKESSRI